jgi:hypothetical protein
MSAKKIVRCQRCGKRLKRGGDNYRLECSIVADFDGYIDTSGQTSSERLIEEITSSGMTESELQEQVYYALKQKLCFDCRNAIVDFLKGYD